MAPTTGVLKPTETGVTDMTENSALCADCFAEAYGEEPDMGSDWYTFEQGTCVNDGRSGIVFRVIVEGISPVAPEAATDADQSSTPASKPEPKWSDDQLAYDGSSLDPARELTPRERDVLCRLLHSIVYPFTAFAYNLPGSKEHREAIARHTRALAPGNMQADLEMLAGIIGVISPREDDRR